MKKALPLPLQGPFVDFRNEEFSLPERSGVEPAEVAKSVCAAAKRAYGAKQPAFGLE
jgi:hypothetical protein